MDAEPTPENAVQIVDSVALRLQESVSQYNHIDMRHTYIIENVSLPVDGSRNRAKLLSEHRR
jgi:hypothetical protein